MRRIYNMVILIMSVNYTNKPPGMAMRKELEAYRRSRTIYYCLYSFVLTVVPLLAICSTTFSVKQMVENKQTAKKQAKMNEEIESLKKEVEDKEAQITTQEAEIARLKQRAGLDYA